MKKFKNIIIGILILFGVSISTLSFAQEWGEIGTQWVYKLVNQSQLNMQKYEVVKDTLIDNLDAKIIRTSTLLYTGIDTMVFYLEVFGQNQVLRYSNDSVFWYKDGNFKFLYNFSPPMNEEWITPENPDFNCVNNLAVEDIQKVKGFSTRNIDGNDIDIIELEQGQDWTLGNEIYIGISPKQTFMPMPGDNCGGIDVQSSGPFTTSLFCFYSPSTGGIQFFSFSQITVVGPSPCDDLVSTTQLESKRFEEISIYPNPVNNEYIQIRNNTNKEISKILIYDITGKLIKESKLQKSQLVLSRSNFINGVYFLQFIGEENLILETQKIIINHD